MRRFGIPEVAKFARKDPTTVRKWFERMIGVLKYPRGQGSQKPSLEIPEAIARAKMLEIGYSPEEIEVGLIQPHDRLMQEAEVAVPNKRGRPAKATRSRKRVAS